MLYESVSDVASPSGKYNFYYYVLNSVRVYHVTRKDCIHNIHGVILRYHLWICGGPLQLSAEKYILHMYMQEKAVSS